MTNLYTIISKVILCFNSNSNILYYKFLKNNQKNIVMIVTATVGQDGER